MQTENVSVTPAAAEAFRSFYLAELDARIKRSEAVGAITLNKGSAALFFDASTGKFTLVEKMPNVEEANVFDCEPREQWGRTVMLFGHANQAGGFIPSGHATLDASTLKIKLASGHYYRLEVDPAQASLQPFVSLTPLVREAAPRPERSEKKPRTRPQKNKPRQFADGQTQEAAAQDSPRPAADVDEENEDLTEDDLRRLRGEMPLSSKPKKKWKR